MPCALEGPAAARRRPRPAAPGGRHRRCPASVGAGRAQRRRGRDRRRCSRQRRGRHGRGRRLGLSALPGQTAVFTSAAVDGRSGSSALPGQPARRRGPRRRRRTLFAQLYDVGPGGAATLPEQLVAPMRLTGVPPAGTTVHGRAAGRRPRRRGRPPAAARRLDDRPGVRAAGRTRSYTVALAGDRRCRRPACPTVLGGAAASAPLLPWARRSRSSCCSPPVVGGFVVRRAAAHARTGRTRRWPACRSRSRGWARRTRTGSARSATCRSGSSTARCSGLLGPERRRQDHHPADADGADRADRRARSGLRAPVRPGRAGAVAGRRVRRGPGLPAAPVRPGEPAAVLAAPPAGPPTTPTSTRRSRSPGSATTCDRRVKTYSHGMRQRLAHRPGHARPARAAGARRADQRARPAADPRDARGAAPLRRRPAAP